ncbi:hypothetical protein ACPOL_6346 [Acidisarcina polymorpha]|uniref:Uncharacterized protein n=1 Tax=Acidisarcina polymorpha TaxID=2211140 RepID=A0A2Z5G9C0_9BACT|nr:hypothetical protein ACPOL_6346 [Acidisarcina polymorpha]
MRISGARSYDKLEHISANHAGSIRKIPSIALIVAIAIGNVVAFT